MDKKLIIQNRFTSHVVFFTEEAALLSSHIITAQQDFGKSHSSLLTGFLYTSYFRPVRLFVQSFIMQITIHSFFSLNYVLWKN